MEVPTDRGGLVARRLEVDDQAVVRVLTAKRSHISVRRPGQVGYRLDASADEAATRIERVSTVQAPDPLTDLAPVDRLNILSERRVGGHQAGIMLNVRSQAGCKVDPRQQASR